MDTLYKSTPRPIFNNIKDSSRNQTPSVPEQLPTHLPHMFGFAAKGSIGAKLGGGGTLRDTFGDATFDPATKFANHQTVLAADLMGRQQIFFERLPAPGMSTAMLRLAIEIVCDEIDDYTRDPETGAIIRDVNGDPQVSGTINGQRIRWVLNPTQFSANGFGEAPSAPAAGTLTSTLAGQTSLVYPIMDIPVSFNGVLGNGLGIRFGSPVTTGANPADAALMEAIKAYMYTIEVVEQSSAGTPVTVATLGGDLSVSGTLKPSVRHPRLDTNLSFQDTFIDSYRRTDVPGMTDKEGPFENFYVYQDHFDAVLERLIFGTNIQDAPAQLVVESEFDQGNAAGGFERTGANAMADAENSYMLNPFTGKDLNNVQYFSFVMASGADAGVTVSATSSLYASGGSDGDTSARAFDEAVRTRLENYDSFASPSVALNMARYPWSDYYDTGFALDTKKQFANITALRPDIQSFISTQEVMAPAPDDTNDDQPYVAVAQNDLVTENAMTQILSTHIRSIPESVVYGTETCRVRLAQHSGYIMNSPYKGLVTLNHELAQRRSVYMGSGDGIWNQGQSPQIDPNNNVQSLYRLNHTYRPADAYDSAWDAGAIWVQNYNMSRDFIPAWRTVYRYADSVLMSSAFVDACVEATKAHFRVWRQLVGRDDLTSLEFQEESDRLLSEELPRSRFDNRFEIRVRTVISDDDSARGWSWQSFVEIYGNKMKLVGSFTVDGRDMADLPA